MDLKTFVSETLCQIQEGVEDAIRRRAAVSGKGVINPVYSRFHEATKELVEKVQFDVAVTVAESGSKGEHSDLRVVAVSLGDESSDQRKAAATSRVQFSIPIVSPTTIVDQDRTDAVNREFEALRGRNLGSV